MRMYVKINGKVVGPLEWEKILRSAELGRLGEKPTVSDDKILWLSIPEAKKLMKKNAEKEAASQNNQEAIPKLKKTENAAPQPGNQQPGLQQPGYQQQGYQRPGYQQPGFQQPGFQQPGFQQPGFQQPGFQQQGFQQQGFQQPGFQQPGFQQPGVQQPGFQQPGFQQPGFQQQGSQQQPGNHQGNNTKVVGCIVAIMFVVFIGIVFTGWRWYTNRSVSSEITVHVTVTKWLAGTFDSWKYNCEYKLYADNACVATRNSTSMSVSFDVKVKKGAELRAEMLPKNGFGGIAETLEGPASWEKKITASHSGQNIKIECK